MKGGSLLHIVYNNTIVFVAAGTIDITNFGALSLFDDTKPKLYTCGFGVADSFGGYVSFEARCDQSTCEEDGDGRVHRHYFFGTISCLMESLT